MQNGCRTRQSQTELSIFFMNIFYSATVDSNVAKCPPRLAHAVMSVVRVLAALLWLVCAGAALVSFLDPQPDETYWNQNALPVRIDTAQSVRCQLMLVTRSTVAGTYDGAMTEVERRKISTHEFEVSISHLSIGISTLECRCETEVLASVSFYVAGPTEEERFYSSVRDLLGVQHPQRSNNMEISPYLDGPPRSCKAAMHSRLLGVGDSNNPKGAKRDVKLEGQGAMWCGYRACRPVHFCPGTAEIPVDFVEIVEDAALADMLLFTTDATWLQSAHSHCASA